MKKHRSAIILLVFALLLCTICLAGCQPEVDPNINIPPPPSSEQYEPSPEQDEPSPKQDEPSPDEQLKLPTQSPADSAPEEPWKDSGLSIMGEIRFDVFYKGIEVSLILEEQPEATLGTPSDSRGPNYFYDGLELYFTDYVSNIWGNDLSLFEIAGVTLDKNRAELIAAFGEPIEYYEYPDYVYDASDDNRMMRYHVTSYIIDYMLDFWFDDPDEKAYSIGIMRIGQ